MIFRLVVTGILLGSSSLVAFALSLLSTHDYDNRVIIKEPDRTISTLKAGETSYLIFQIRNPTGKPVRIVGLTQC